MSVNSKKRRLVRRAAIRAGLTVNNGLVKLYDELTQITNKQLKQEKKKWYLPLSEFLRRQDEQKAFKKEFRAERRKHKLELQRAAEKAKRAKNRERQKIKEERRAQRLKESE